MHDGGGTIVRAARYWGQPHPYLVVIRKNHDALIQIEQIEITPRRISRRSLSPMHTKEMFSAGSQALRMPD